MAPDARTISNMRILSGGERKRKHVIEFIQLFSSYVLTEDDIGQSVPPRWQDNIKVGKK